MSGGAGAVGIKRPAATHVLRQRRWMVRIHVESHRSKKSVPSQPSFYNRGRHRTRPTGGNRHERLHCNDRRPASELMARRVRLCRDGLMIIDILAVSFLVIV